MNSSSIYSSDTLGETTHNILYVTDNDIVFPDSEGNKNDQDNSATGHAVFSNVTVSSENGPFSDKGNEHFGANLNNEPLVILSNIRKKNINRVILGHININHLAGKFEDLKYLIKDKLDILVVTETKIDDSYPTTQFIIEGFSPPFRLDRNANGGGVLIYVSNLIPCNQVDFISRPNDIEGIFLEIKLRKTKWLLMGGYNPNKQTISYFLEHVSNNLDKHMGNFDNFLLIGDFNSTMLEKQMSDFCLLYDLSNLINEPTCYKNPLNPTSIDVILTNRENSFQDSVAIETGLSDHHKMIVTVLKFYMKQKKPITIKYRCYKSFCMNDFTENLKQNLENFNQVLSYDDFKTIFMSTLDYHAPEKKKTVRGNQAPFMSQVLSKAIMHRSKLKNKYNKNPTEVNQKNYKKQRNVCVNLLRKEKKRYYNNLSLNVIEDNRKFWKNIKPLFSEKHKAPTRNIFIIEDDIIISDNKKVAEKLNKFFVDSVENLDIEPFYVQENQNSNTDDDIDNIIHKYSLHPSVLRIKECIKPEVKFEFKDITADKIKKDICELNTKKACVENDIPASILVGSGDIVSDYIADIYNNSKNECKFDNSLKFGTVVPINKTTTKTTNKKDYRPVSLLPLVSKIYETNMHEEIFAYVDKLLSPYIFGYRKNHSTEQCLTIMLETWKKALDSKHSTGGLLTDLSKAFDCLNHELLIAKLDAYGFGKESCKFIFDYLKNRKQRTKVGDTYSEWLETKWGVPQGSILGPLLFNIFINDIFFFIEKTDIANYADDNTLYATDKNLDDMLRLLEDETSVVLNWFRINEMKPNEKKCHLIVPNQTNVSVTLGNELIEAEDSVTLLGVIIDKRLDFSDHISNLLKKGNQKLHALARISKFVCKNKLKLIMRTFIQSQFNYCPLLWMFHSRSLNNKINKLHERALRLVYKNDNLNFQELLDLDNSVTVHQKNLQRLAIEMYKVKNNIAPIHMQNLFDERIISTNLRKQTTWIVPKTRTVNYGTETVRYRGPQIWESLPNTLKNAKSLKEFKNKITRWKKIDCTCRHCKTYISNLGFLT